MYIFTEKQITDLINEIKDGKMVDISKYKKRSRTKNEVNKQRQCRAKRADGKQCSRQRKEGKEFCGTHIKGCPHGTYKLKEQEKEELKLSIIDYKGIAYYIDLKTGEVYSSESVMKGGEGAEVIGMYDGSVVIEKKSQ